MNFHLCCVVLALAVSSSTAMPGQCTIPAVEHGQVGRYSTKIFQDDRFRECFTQILTGEKVSDSNSVTLRCEKGYLPAGSSQISKVHRFKEDVVTCEDGTWSKPLRCEAEITCGEPPPIEYAATISLFTEDYPLGSIVSYECQSGYVIKGRTTASQCVMSDDGSQAVWTKAPMSCVAQSCGDPGIVANAHRIGSDFTFPHTAEYECEEGYKLNGTGVRHCEPSGMWSGKLPTCEPQSCGDPGLVINASRIGSEFTFPHTVKFECEESYKLNGTDVRQCQADGLWSGKLPTCEKVHCERPRNPENGNVSFISLEYGTELRYECNKGFNLSNHQQRRCIGNGTWSNEEPVCKAQTCGDPGFVVNASRTGNDFTFPHTVKFECDEGYKLNGTDVLQCQADGLWSGKLPTCEQRSCGDPGLVVNASRIGSEFTFPHTVKFECKEGYKLNGTGVRQCQADGAWSGKLPTCERIYCERPRNPENGNVSFISLEYGTELRYECNKGFNLNNHQQRHCTGNGTWSNEEPACKEVTCDDPQAPDNGFRQLTDGLKVDSSVIYSCADGKMLVGESTSKCLIDGHWTFTPPECVDISCGEPPPIEFATVTSLFTKEYPLGAIVAYECQLGYVIKGRTATSQCVMSDDGSQAIWTKAQLSCSANATCGHPPQMFGAIYPNVQGRKFPIGTKVTYTCASGYVGKGSDRYESVCEYLKPLRRGLWTYPDAYCRPQSCGDPGFVANASRIGSDFTFRRTVKFECKEGYKLKGADVLSCEANGTWSGELPTCEQDVTCDSPPLVKGAKPPRTRDKEYDIGEVFTYTCEYGYIGKGSGRFQSTCEFDEQSGTGQWSDPNVVCTRNVTCSRPPQVNGAKGPNVKGRNFHLGRTVTYTCASGHVSQGSGRFQSVCEFDEESGRGRWSNPNVDCTRRKNPTRKPETSAVHKPTSDPEEAFENAKDSVERLDEDPPILSTEVPERGSHAEKNGETSSRKPIKVGDQEDQEEDKDGNATCDRPPPVEGAIAPRVREKVHAIGTVVTYLCEFGFVSRGSAKFQSECEKDEKTGKGRWSDPNVVCIPRSCGDPGFVINARRIGSVFTFPHTVEFECEEGYKLNGAGVRYCQASGVWSGKLPTCEQVYCERPRNPENGRVRYIGLEYGTELRYECNKGFLLSNYQQRYCTENGTWSNEEPVCMEANCDEPQIPKHGFRQLTGGLKVDSLVIYSCEEGKILLGASTSKCLSDGQWTFPPPQCVDHCEVPYVQHGTIGQYEIKTKYYREHKVFVPFAEGQKVKPNEMIYLRCNKDFVLEAGSKTSEKQITCEDGTWSVPLQCKSVSCNGDPPPMENGQPVTNIRTHGHVIYYRCHEFYEKTTTGHVECVYGKWVGYTPVCTDARCYTNQLDFPGLVKPKGEFIAHKKDFSISCEEGYKKAVWKRKISCNLGKWNIDNNPCIEELDVRCPEIDEKGIFTVRYNNSRKVNSAAYYYCKDQDLKILGFNFRICQEDGEWSGGDPECAEPEFQCPEIDDKGVFTVRYNNDRKVNSAAYYFCKYQDQKMHGSDVRTCQEDGKWSGRDPECVAKASSGFSNEKASTTSPPTSASHPQTASREPSTGVSLDSQKQDDCCCTSNYGNTNILSSHEGELTLLGTKVKKGDSVEIRCKDGNSTLVWRNGLRASGPVSLTCDTCQTWGVEDIPSCVKLSAGDTWIVLSRNMKLLPGGIIEIRQNENVQIQCSVLSGFPRMHYPEWRSSPPKTVDLSYNAAGSELRTLMLIDGFEAEFTGRYDCSATDTRGYQYGPTILNLTIAKAEMRCPVLNEKDDFIISYSNSRKVNSIAFYFCRKQTKEIRGTSFRTCLESGEWSSEDPSCQDIVCPKFIWNRYMDIWYSNEQHVDSVATFQCRVPRILIGSPTSTCLGNGTWSHSLPTCELASSSRHGCSELDRKGIFIITYSNRRNVNSVAYYNCQNVSKKIHGSSTRTCKHNGDWSDSEPVCVDITCRKFGVFGSLTVEYTKENKVGSIAEFHCTPPAVLVGSFIAMCSLNGTWSKPQPSCEEPDVRCPEIEEKGIFIVRYNDDRKIGSDASYSCKGPDQKMTGSNVRKCQEDGEWSGDDPVCEAPGCEIDSLMASLKPDVVPNLQNVTGELLPSGFELTLFCDNNMVLEGNNKVKCNQQGRWNVGNVQCILGCFVDSSNSASTLIVEPKKEFYRFGEIAVLSCPKGFELTTEVERVMCMGRTGWSDPLPDCKNMINQED